PGEEWEAVEVAVQPFVLPHDLACGLDERAEPLCGGHGLCDLLRARGFFRGGCSGHDFFRLGGVKELLKFRDGCAELVCASESLRNLSDIAEIGEWRDVQ